MQNLNIQIMQKEEILKKEIIPVLQDLLPEQFANLDDTQKDLLYGLFNSLLNIQEGKDINFVESDLQEVIENHFWIFGEEYHMMLCAEEDNFTKLRDIYYQRVKKIPKEKYENYKISKKQVDLFICGNTSEGRLTKNLIVEIKRPSKKINYSDDFRQIEDYSRIINKEPQFNTSERDNWDFILLCKDIIDKDKKDFEEKYTDKFKGLIYDNKRNIRIFVIKWSDLLKEVQFRLNFLKKKMEEKKSKMKTANKETKKEFLSKFDNSAKIIDV